MIIELLRSSWLLQMIFDPTMSKKKKKKKKPFMLDEEGGGDTQAEETQQSETKEVEPEPTEDKDVEADEEDSRKKGKWIHVDKLSKVSTSPVSRIWHPRVKQQSLGAFRALWGISAACLQGSLPSCLESQTPPSSQGLM